MNNIILLILLSIFVASIYAQYIITGSEDEYQPAALFIKRNSLSNMMRLGKRALTIKKNCEDCHLGNLMRLGR